MGKYDRNKYFKEEYLGCIVGSYKVVDIISSAYNESVPIWVVECVCGRRSEAQPSWIISGMIPKCICGARGREGTSDDCTLDEFEIKESDRQKIRKIRRILLGRCYDVNNTSYRLYGEKGIRVQQEWILSLESFINWCKKSGYRPWYNLYRFNESDGFNESNCYWDSHSREKESIHMEYDREKFESLGVDIDILEKEIGTGRIGETELESILGVIDRKRKKDNSTSIRLRKSLELCLNSVLRNMYNVVILSKALNIKKDTKKVFKAQQYIENAQVLMQLALEELKGAD